MHGEKITGWRNRPPAPASAGSVFLTDRVFNGYNTRISERVAATKALQPVTLPGSISCESRNSAQDKRRKLVKASI